MAGLGIQLHTSWSLEDLKESGFGNRPIGINPSPQMFLWKHESQILFKFQEWLAWFIIDTTSLIYQTITLSSSSSSH